MSLWPYTISDLDPRTLLRIDGGDRYAISGGPIVRIVGSVGSDDFEYVRRRGDIGGRWIDPAVPPEPPPEPAARIVPGVPARIIDIEDRP